MQALLQKYKNIKRTPKSSSSFSSSGQGVKAPEEVPVAKHRMHGVLEKVRASCREEVAPSSSSVGGDQLSILVLIIDDFPHEAVWRQWLARAEESARCRVKFLFHAKYPDKVRSSWVREHLVEWTFKPNWGSVEITKAMLGLLRRAVAQDPGRLVGRFVFASESCVPLQPVEEALASIFASEKSWMRPKAKANNGYSQERQFNVLKGKVPLDCIVKADQWVLLNRVHAEGLLQLPSLIHAHSRDEVDGRGRVMQGNVEGRERGGEEGDRERQDGRAARSSTSGSKSGKSDGYDEKFADSEKSLFALFGKVGASDEMFIPTCLALLGHVVVTPGARPHLSTAAGPAISLRPVTFCDWEDPPGKNPLTFHSLTQGIAAAKERDALRRAKDSGCIFFRKLKPDPHASTTVPSDRALATLGPAQSPYECVAVDWFRAVYPEADVAAAVADFREVYVAVRAGVSSNSNNSGKGSIEEDRPLKRSRIG